MILCLDLLQITQIFDVIEGLERLKLKSKLLELMNTYLSVK